MLIYMYIVLIHKIANKHRPNNRLRAGAIDKVNSGDKADNTDRERNDVV